MQLTSEQVHTAKIQLLEHILTYFEYQKFAGWMHQREFSQAMRELVEADAIDMASNQDGTFYAYATEKSYAHLKDLQAGVSRTIPDGGDQLETLYRIITSLGQGYHPKHKILQAAHGTKAFRSPYPSDEAVKKAISRARDRYLPKEHHNLLDTGNDGSVTVNGDISAYERLVTKLGTN